MTPSVLYLTACSSERVTFRPDAFLHGARWATLGGTQPSAHALRREISDELEADHVRAVEEMETDASWYGYDTREAALAAEAGLLTETVELQRYRVPIESPLRPYDKTPCLTTSQAALRLRDGLTAWFDVFGYNCAGTPYFEEGFAAHVEHAIAVIDRLDEQAPFSHAELWDLAYHAAVLSDPELGAPDEVLTEGFAQLALAFTLTAMGFDAVHLCPDRGWWWLPGYPPKARPELIDATLLPHHSTTE